jgi:hypothetical protein
MHCFLFCEVTRLWKVLFIKKQCQPRVQLKLVEMWFITNCAYSIIGVITQSLLTTNYAMFQKCWHTDMKMLRWFWIEVKDTDGWSFKLMIGGFPTRVGRMMLQVLSGALCKVEKCQTMIILALSWYQLCQTLCIFRSNKTAFIVSLCLLTLWWALHAYFYYLYTYYIKHWTKLKCYHTRMCYCDFWYLQYVV